MHFEVAMGQLNQYNECNWFSPGFFYAGSLEKNFAGNGSLYFVCGLCLLIFLAELNCSVNLSISLLNPI